MSHKILIGTNALPPQIGGLENLSNDLALHLHQLGYLVTVFLSSDYGHTQPDRDFKTITLDSFLVERLPIPTMSRNNVKRIFSLRKDSFDLVILQTHLFMSNWLLAILLRSRSKILWINYGGSTVKHKSRFISMLIQIYELIGWKILDFCSDIRLAQSEKSRRRFGKRSSQVKIINNCIPDNFLNLDLYRGKIKNVRRLLFVGRFVQDKRILELLEEVKRSLDKLQENHSSVLDAMSLTLVGDGPLRERVLKFMADESRIDWKVQELPDRDSVLAEMLKHDLLIQFPLSEGQPGVTIEALTIGLPILTTPIEDCLESLDGVFVSESISFADRLASIVADISDFELDFAMNREHLRAHHSVGGTVDSIMRVLW